MLGFFVSWACLASACQPTPSSTTTPHAELAGERLLAQPRALPDVGCVELRVGQAPQRCLTAQEQERLWDLTAHVVCLVSAEPRAAQGRLSPELLERSAGMLSQAGLDDPLAWARAAREHPQPLQRALAQRCPQAPAWAVELVTEGTLPQTLRDHDRALDPDAHGPAPLPEEAERYLAVAEPLGCGALRGEGTPQRRERLRVAKLDEAAWVALAERWRDEPRVAQRLARALARCPDR